MGAVFALVAAAIIGTVGYYVKSQRDSITVTAQFDSAAGLYVENVVAVVGMPVGKVTKITPRGSYVDVEFTVDKDVQVPADVHAVTINTSILTDRQIELTPPYSGGPVLQNNDTIGLPRTKTPIAFDRVIDMLDKLSKSLAGDGKGGGPIADLVNSAAGVVDGNGERIKSALGELSDALRLSSDGGEVTGDQLTTIITDLDPLMEAAAQNDAKLREFGSTTHQLTQILADENFGTGATGRKINEIIQKATTLVDENRDNLKQTVLNADTAAGVITDRQREMAELLDVAPLALENLYNIVDQDNGALRVHALTDKILVDSQSSKEICNLMHLRQLGCSTGTLQDYGPDFGLTYVLDGLAAMGQR
ncbi:putative MCE family protein [Mycolicibacterium cyprinidarum]|uniref:MCE family protein n=1 Tax=Mycolicibacterium cyprinidarum TaxID=2860311 RepID=A0ABQ4V9V7_9MYCO|nr:putative MCE family protein [Mycolicibacterium sp. NGTWSNA01]GJF19235.1 putative MCE family protein [Mycolicibacterium sp. NGTWS0302]